MKLTKRQEEELDCIRYFMPEALESIPITEEDILNYFAWSERGIETKTKNDITRNEYDGLDALKQAKRWRGVHCDSSKTNRAMYEEGILDGSMPYFTILGGWDGAKTNALRKMLHWFFPKKISKYRLYHNPVPRSVVNYMKKSLFGGIDAENIERTYQLILNNKA